MLQRTDVHAHVAFIRACAVTVTNNCVQLCTPPTRCRKNETTKSLLDIFGVNKATMSDALRLACAALRAAIADHPLAVPRYPTKEESDLMFEAMVTRHGPPPFPIPNASVYLDGANSHLKKAGNEVEQVSGRRRSQMDASLYRWMLTSLQDCSRNHHAVQHAATQAG